MNEETSETVEATESVEQAPAPSLDEIAKEFSVEEQVSQFHAQPGQSNESQTFIPDPISDPDQYNQYVRQQSSTIDNVSKSVKELSEKLSAHENRMIQQQVEADLNRAVATVNKKLGVENEMAEIALRMEYEKNPSFQKIWDNRSKNPEAFDKALNAVADKYAQKFAVKQDPQLTENQMAAKKSLQTMNKSPSEDPNSKWENMDPGEFEREWDRMRRG